MRRLTLRGLLDGRARRCRASVLFEFILNIRSHLRLRLERLLVLRLLILRRGLARRGSGLCGLRSGRWRRAESGSARRRRGQALAQLFYVKFRMPRGCDAIFIRGDVGVGTMLQLLQVRRKLEERNVFSVLSIYRDHGMPGQIFLEPFNLYQKENEDDVDDNRNPCGFAAAGARQIVLQLNEQMRHARIVI